VRWAIVLALLGAAATARAEPLDLRLRDDAPPTTLRMRRVAQQDTAKKAAKTVGKTATTAAKAVAKPLTEGATDIARLVRRRDTVKAPLKDRLVLRVDLGFAVDGARAGSDLTAAQQAALVDYAPVRSYGLGEVYLGSHGIGASYLSTYTASQLRFATSEGLTRPIPSPLDEVPDFQNRHAWIEANDMFESRWLKPLRVRAGRIYVYAPTIVHFSGLLLAWEKPWIDFSLYSGARVNDYHARSITADSQDARRTDDVEGSQLHVDLHRYKIPLVLGLGSLRFGEHFHSELSGTVEPRKNVVIRSSSRFMDGKLARQRLVVRARVSEDSTVMVDNQLRTRSDWFWDYASISAVDADSAADTDVAARRYLDLGIQQPRFQTALQAGTVIAQNLDLLARGAIALDLQRDEGATINTHLPEYVEGGAGVEVRLRRALALTASGLIRDYKRPVAHGTDVMGVADPLPAEDELGEEYIVEGGVSARYTAGARRFSAQGELYGRRTRWAPLYERAGVREEVKTLHGGGRFFIDAWVNPQVRLRVEYDLSTLVEESPQFRGLKQLRFYIEGTY
jgi:hypothetical protein